MGAVLYMYKERSTRRWKLCQVGDERARVEESSWRDKHVNTVVHDGISEFKFDWLTAEGQELGL